jgi:hypothetical protein
LERNPSGTKVVEISEAHILYPIHVMIFEAIKAKRAEAQEQLLLSLEYIP